MYYHAALLLAAAERYSSLILFCKYPSSERADAKVLVGMIISLMIASFEFVEATKAMNDCPWCQLRLSYVFRLVIWIFIDLVAFLQSVTSLFSSLLKLLCPLCFLTQEEDSLVRYSIAK